MPSACFWTLVKLGGKPWQTTWNAVDMDATWWNLGSLGAAFRIPSWWKSNLSLNGRPLGATCAIVYSNARLLDCSAICLYFELSFDSGVSTHFLCDLQFHWISLTLDFQKSLTLRCSRTKTKLTKVHIPSYGRCLHGCWTVLGSVRAFERALKSNVFSNKTNKMWVYPATRNEDHKIRWLMMVI